MTSTSFEILSHIIQHGALILVELEMIHILTLIKSSSQKVIYLSHFIRVFSPFLPKFNFIMMKNDKNHVSLDALLRHPINFFATLIYCVKIIEQSHTHSPKNTIRQKRLLHTLFNIYEDLSLFEPSLLPIFFIFFSWSQLSSCYSNQKYISS